jgi:phenylacetic acid degradation operon negative regulatory protein
MNPRPRAPFPAELASALRHFRAQRPLRGGSLLVTIFGDAIAPRGGAVALESLIRLAAPFGLTERLVRTAVARLAREGWLSARRQGRRSEYRLSRLGAARFAEATQRIYAAAPAHWERRWTLLLLPPDRARPASVRESLRWHGFGQLQAGVFAHPGATPAEALAWLRELPGVADALVLESRADALAVDRRLAARGWNLSGLGGRYRRFVRRFEPLTGALAAGALDGECAFVARTLLIHEYRKIHLQDPLLPPSLLPPDWVGARAYELARRLYALVLAPSEQYLALSARRLDTPLRAAEPALYARFGA